MDNYKSVEEILVQLREWYGSLQDQFDGSETISDSNAALIREFSTAHLRYLTRALNFFDEEKKDLIKKTWVQFVPFSEILEQDTVRAINRDSKDIHRLAIDLNERLLNFYHTVMKQNGMPDEASRFFSMLFHYSANQISSIEDSIYESAEARP